MNLNELKEKLTSKKVLITVVGILLISWLIREVMMWNYMHEFQEKFIQFNAQFEEQQKIINNKINEADRKFENRQRSFDEAFNSTGKIIEKARDEFQKTIIEIEKSALERERKFDEAFAKGPSQLFYQHKIMGDKMFNEFKKESKHRSDYFKKDVLNVDKKLEKMRCFMAIGERPNDRDAPFGLTPQQLKDRYKNLMRIRRELAKSNHCEAYV